MTSSACDDAAASPAPASGPAAGARGVRAAAAPRCPAPGSDIEKKRVMAFSAAARLCGGDKVTMTPDGVIEVNFRHSKDVPLEFVDEYKDLLMQELGVSRQQLQRWRDKVQAKSFSDAAAAAAPAADEPSKRARARARQKANRAASAAAAAAEAAELRARLVAAGVEPTSTTTSATPDAEMQPADDELAQRAIDEVTRRAGATATARGVAVESRFAELEQTGEPRPIALPAGTVGAAFSPQTIGQTVVAAIDGRPPEQFGAAIDIITTKLFALAGPLPFGGGGVLAPQPQPFGFGFGSAPPSSFGAGPSHLIALGEDGRSGRKFKEPSAGRG